jgi:hypothetical protein
LLLWLLLLLWRWRWWRRLRRLRRLRRWRRLRLRLLRWPLRDHAPQCSDRGCARESLLLLLLLLLSSLLLLLLPLLLLVPLVEVLQYGPPLHSLLCLYVPCLYVYPSVRECGVHTFTVRVVGCTYRT